MTHNKSTRAAQAKSYLLKGLRVLPIACEAKSPVLAGFTDLAWTATPADFHAGDQVAILCGPCPALAKSGDWLLCIDLDGELNQAAAGAALGVALPPTLATHAEKHLWYRVRPSAQRDRLKQWGGLLGARRGWRGVGKAPDIDLKWLRGYAVEKGDPATFDMKRIAVAPLSLLDALLAAPGASSARDAEPAQPRNDLPEPRDISEAEAEALIEAAVTEWPAVGGGRHDASKALGGAMRRAGVEREDAEAIMTAIAESVQSPAARVTAALDAWDRTDAGEPAYGRTTLRELLDGSGKATLDALDALTHLPAWAEAWARQLELRHAPRGPALAPGATLGPAIDAAGLRRCPSTGWPWIVQKGDLFWLHRSDAVAFSNECQTREIIPEIRRVLGGVIPDDERTLDALRNEWVEVVSDVRSSYTARANTYDPTTRTLMLAALSWVAPEHATYHAHIDLWLRALFAGGYDRGAQWLASCGSLDRPAPCLYLTGPKAIGKTLLVDGLAMLWGKPAASTLRETISSFNESTGDRPLVFSDEGFPKELDFQDFRDLVTAHTRRVNVKFGRKTSVEGCIRIVLAANNADAMRYQRIGSLTPADLDAIADRLLVLPCSADARGVLEAHTQVERDSWARHEIAEHVLWLAATVPLATTAGRMAAEPGGGERLLERVVIARGADVLLKIEAAIRAGRMSETYGVVAVDAATVRVNVTRLHAAMVADRTTKVTIADVKETCASLALRPGTEQHKVGGLNLKWRVIDRLRLESMLAELD